MGYEKYVRMAENARMQEANRNAMAEMLKAIMYGNRQYDPKIAKENRATVRSLLSKAAADDNLEEVKALVPVAQGQGVDPTPYMTASGITPKKDEFTNILQEFLISKLKADRAAAGIAAPQSEGTTTEPMVDTTTTTAPASTPHGEIPPEATPHGEIPSESGGGMQGGQAQAATQPQPTQPAQPQEAQPQLFTDELMTRMALKRFANIDVERNPELNKQWFREFGELRQQNVPVSQAINILAAKHGFIPDGASNLHGLSDMEREVLFSKTFPVYMDDPVIDEVFGKMFPGAIDKETNKLNPKVKAGIILQALSKEGYTIPDRYLPLLDRFRGLAEPNFISDEIASIVYEMNGKFPAEITPQDLREASKALKDRKLISIAEEVEAREKAQFNVLLEAPIPHNVAESMGLPVNTTHEELYKMQAIPYGKDSQESYIKGALNLLDTMAPIAENLFTAEGFNRFARGGQLAWEKFKQSNPKLASWEAMRMSLAFSLAKAFGERGVLSRQDVKPYLEAIPSTFHSKTFAKGFFDMQRQVLENRVEQMRQPRFTTPSEMSQPVEGATATRQKNPETGEWYVWNEEIQEWQKEKKKNKNE